MNNDVLIIVVFAVLGVASLLIFAFCAWSDRHESASDRPEEEKRKK